MYQCARCAKCSRCSRCARYNRSIRYISVPGVPGVPLQLSQMSPRGLSAGPSWHAGPSTAQQWPPSSLRRPGSTRERVTQLPQPKPLPACFCHPPKPHQPPSHVPAPSQLPHLLCLFHDLLHQSHFFHLLQDTDKRVCGVLLCCPELPATHFLRLYCRFLAGCWIALGAGLCPRCGQDPSLTSEPLWQCGLSSPPVQGPQHDRAGKGRRQWIRDRSLPRQGKEGWRHQGRGWRSPSPEQGQEPVLVLPSVIAHVLVCHRCGLWQPRGCCNTCASPVATPAHQDKPCGYSQSQREALWHLQPL